ncbi:MAG TPA: TIGR04282 family arsenosugar biosynthesis glycosyltransferase [Roseiflexaceae bacterium]|nr:TIGR04282 family arsenosugar biosynthesis glycosyltransferase [Roseiflexaceae bacterium]
MHRALIVVAKRPAAGQTKTRLCPPLDGAAAAALYGCFLHDVLDVARRVPGVRRTLAYLPADTGGYFARLAPDMERVPQRGVGLGERLDHLLADALAVGAHQAVVMSSDSPTLPAAYVAAAFEHLDGPCDVVLGPCDDGGYYLIGLKAPRPRLLREVPMSTPTVLRDTLALAGELGLRAALLPPWYDVDTPADLVRLRDELACAPQSAPRTRALLHACRPSLHNTEERFSARDPEASPL